MSRTHDKAVVHVGSALTYQGVLIGFYISILHFFIYLACVSQGMHMRQHVCEGRWMSWSSQFCSHHMGPEIKLRSLGLVTSAITH